ncbi:MAG: SsrA-binding protein SmpB [Lentisphaerae bacterium]|nr:SsrA-binding protein SmpB [Lentisphaerota bacterium]MBQ4328861.1 SsrA-binding protein SmpB [Lentisphaeria bacterium]MBR2720179.1 SsrA-binding protein SmpB [Lentisphaeria bacterium]
MPRKDPKDPVLATNRKAFHDYNVLERFEAGIQLVGTEVKSCRARAIQLQEGFVKIENNQALLYNVHIAGYDFGNRFNHNTKQTRRLLLHKKEILKLAQWVNTKGGTIIPLKFYLTNGLVKVEIAYCQGKTHADQRETLRKRETEREMQRFVRK